MQIIPAIDLRGGRCVRLRQGDYEQETVFADDPATTARRWAADGARRLHLVDLDGARSGRPVTIDAVRAILEAIDIPCQLGGGVRDHATVAAWFAAGVERLVIGSRALKDPAWFREISRDYPGRIILGLDARAGRVATDGWLDTTDVDAIALAEQFDDLPLAAVIYTDIARDGMLAGPDLDVTADLATRLQTPVIASGGIGSLADIAHLAGLPIAGCIVGRALYEGRFGLAEAISIAV